MTAKDQTAKDCEGPRSRRIVKIRDRKGPIARDPNAERDRERSEIAKDRERSDREEGS